PDPVGAWNQLALDTVRQERASDAQAARLYAMVNVAMYDAVNGIDSRKGHPRRAQALIPATGAPADGDRYAAASAAAHAVLVGEYPSRSGSYDTQLDNDLDQLPPGGKTE